MWNVEVSEKGDARKYSGKLGSDQIHLGKTLVISLDDGRAFRIAKVKRALIDVGERLLMLDSSDERRFRVKILTTTKEVA